MKKPNQLSERLTDLLNHHFWSIVLGLLATVVIVIWLLVESVGRLVSIETSNTIDMTPTQVQSIRDIGEWEFLAINDEELVDTMRRGIFTDDQLARIYYGTLRLGIDLSEMRDDHITVDGDTLRLLLPRVRLLDDDFIDEARTRSFYESGRWSPRDREALYQRAKRLMTAHGLTQKNLLQAQANAEEQVGQLLKAMGFDRVAISFEAY